MRGARYTLGESKRVVLMTPASEDKIAYRYKDTNMASRLILNNNKLSLNMDSFYTFEMPLIIKN